MESSPMIYQNEVPGGRCTERKHISGEWRVLEAPLGKAVQSNLLWDSGKICEGDLV